MNDFSVRDGVKAISHYIIPVGAGILSRHAFYYLFGLGRSGSAVMALALGLFLYYSGKHAYHAYFARDEELGRPIQPAMGGRFLRNLFFIQLGTLALTLLAWLYSGKHPIVSLASG